MSDWLDWLRVVGLDTFGRLVIAGSVAAAYACGRFIGTAESRAWRAYGSVLVGVAVVWVFMIGAAGGEDVDTDEAAEAELGDLFQPATAAALAFLVGGWLGVGRAREPLQIREPWDRARREAAHIRAGQSGTDRTNREDLSMTSAPMSPPAGEGWLSTGNRLVHAARREQYDEAVASGARWLIEGHDLWDFQRGDEDLGVCFRAFGTDAEVDAFVAESTTDQWYRLAGIYDVTQPLTDQGPGIAPENWRAGQRSVARGA
jgi:hypothetical protein